MVRIVKKKRKVSKKTKKNLVILVPVAFVALGLFLGNAFYYTYKIYTLKIEEKNLTQELYDSQEEEEELKNDIEKLQNPEYLARYARENYHYSKSGELVIQRETKTEETEEETSEKKEYNKIFIPCLLALVIVGIYILKHKTKKK